MAIRIVSTLLALSLTGMAEVHSHSESEHDNHSAENGVRFSPHLSTALALGGSTGDADFLAESGHHDPHYDGFNLQAFEVGGALDVGDDFTIFAIYNLQWDREEAWDGHWEEAYMDFRILPSLTIRSGMQLPAFGRENYLHVHARDFVQASLATTRFLGEDGLIMNCVSFTNTWGSENQQALTLGLGSVYAHEHSHDEEEHDDHPLHAEEALLKGNILQARWQSEFRPWQVGVSGIVGENHWERTTFIVGADIERRLRIAGKAATLAAEVSYRNVDAINEDDDQKVSFDETALSLSLAYDFAEDWQWNNRIEWLSGEEMAGLDERTRFSTNVSHLYCWNHTHNTLRLQYDADFLPGGEVENSVWFQIVVEWGDGH